MLYCIYTCSILIHKRMAGLAISQRCHICVSLLQYSMTIIILIYSTSQAREHRMISSAGRRREKTMTGMKTTAKYNTPRKTINHKILHYVKTGLTIKNHEQCGRNTTEQCCADKESQSSCRTRGRVCINEFVRRALKAETASLHWIQVRSRGFSAAGAWFWPWPGLWNRYENPNPAEFRGLLRHYTRVFL